MQANLFVRFCGLSLFGMLAACALPASAPTSSQLESSTTAADFNFTIVPLDARVAAILRKYPVRTLAESFRSGGYRATNALKPGDVISITIYESGGASLFGGTQAPVTPGSVGAPPTTAAGVSTIPPQTIEADGSIFMPYVGHIKVAGKTPAQVGRAIEEMLRGKVVEPQVVVSLVTNVSNTASVNGDVNQPRPVALSLRGQRLLDVISAAGGPKYPDYETFVTVVRGKRVGKVLLQTVVKNPSENIVIRPDDQIYVTHNPRTFAVMGATQKVSQYTFDTEKVTLAEAIARAGGPIDTIGNPAGIYLFRFEPWVLAKAILGDEGPASGTPPEFFPILYRINLNSAEGYFLAQSVQVHDKDVILVTNAEATQLQKLMIIVRGFTGVAYDLKRGTN